jgi:hypothetical protein
MARGLRVQHDLMAARDEVRRELREGRRKLGTRLAADQGDTSKAGGSVRRGHGRD